MTFFLLCSWAEMSPMVVRDIEIAQGGPDTAELV